MWLSVHLYIIIANAQADAQDAMPGIFIIRVPSVHWVILVVSARDDVMADAEHGIHNIS